MKKKKKITVKESGTMGGLKTKKLYGSSHFSKIAKDRHAKERKAKLKKNGRK